MKSIARRFNYMKDKYRDSDDYANFQRAVEGQGFTRKAMSLGFNKLVGKDKYDNNAKTKLLDLAEVSKNSVYDGHFEAKSRVKEAQKSKRYQNSLDKNKAVKRRQIYYYIRKNSEGTYDLWVNDKRLMHGFESEWRPKYHMDTEHPLWIRAKD